MDDNTDVRKRKRDVLMQPEFSFTETYDRERLDKVIKRGVISTEQRHSLQYIKDRLNGNNEYKAVMSERRNKGGRQYPGTKERYAPCYADIQTDVRAYLCEEIYKDVDIQRAHPTMLINLGEMCGLDCPPLREYIHDKERVIDEFKAPFGVEGSQAKQFFTGALYGLSFHSWQKENGCQGIDLPHFGRQYHDQVQAFVQLILAQPYIKTTYAEQIVVAEQQAHAKKKYKVWPSVLSAILDTLERKCVVEAAVTLDAHGVATSSTQYDGLLAAKDERVESLLPACSRAVQEEHGLNGVGFAVKPFDGAGAASKLFCETGGWARTKQDLGAVWFFPASELHGAKTRELAIAKAREVGNRLVVSQQNPLLTRIGSYRSWTMLNRCAAKAMKEEGDQMPQHLWEVIPKDAPVKPVFFLELSTQSSGRHVPLASYTSRICTFLDRVCLLEGGETHQLIVTKQGKEKVTVVVNNGHAFEDWHTASMVQAEAFSPPEDWPGADDRAFGAFEVLLPGYAPIGDPGHPRTLDRRATTVKSSPPAESMLVTQFSPERTTVVTKRSVIERINDPARARAAEGLVIQRARQCMRVDPGDLLNTFDLDIDGDISVKALQFISPGSWDKEKRKTRRGEWGKIWKVACVLKNLGREREAFPIFDKWAKQARGYTQAKSRTFWDLIASLEANENRFNEGTIYSLLHREAPEVFAAIRDQVCRELTTCTWAERAADFPWLSYAEYREPRCQPFWRLFKEKGFKYAILWAGLGTGKTYQIFECLRQIKPKSILVISTRRSAARDYKRRYDQADLYFAIKCYLDILEPAERKKFKFLINSVEGMHHVAGCTYQMVISDEPEDILQQFMSPTNRKHFAGNLSAYANICRKAEYNIFADGTLTNRTLDFIRTVEGYGAATPRPMVALCRNTMRPAAKTAYLYTKEEEFLNHLGSVAHESNFIFTATTSFIAKIDEVLPDLQYITANERRPPLPDGVTAETEDVNDTWRQFPNLAVSPKYTSGVDFSQRADEAEPHFKNIHMVTSANSCNVRNGIQGMTRVRESTNPDRHVHMKGFYAGSDLRNVTSLEELKIQADALDANGQLSALEKLLWTYDLRERQASAFFHTQLVEFALKAQGFATFHMGRDDTEDREMLRRFSTEQPIRSGRGIYAPPDLAYADIEAISRRDFEVVLKPSVKQGDVDFMSMHKFTKHCFRTQLLRTPADERLTNVGTYSEEALYIMGQLYELYNKNNDGFWDTKKHIEAEQGLLEECPTIRTSYAVKLAAVQELLSALGLRSTLDFQTAVPRSKIINASREISALQPRLLRLFNLCKRGSVREEASEENTEEGGEAGGAEEGASEEDTEVGEEAGGAEEGDDELIEQPDLDDDDDPSTAVKRICGLINSVLGKWNVAVTFERVQRVQRRVDGRVREGNSIWKLAPETEIMQWFLDNLRPNKKNRTLVRDR